jgi:hypothetical protein
MEPREQQEHRTTRMEPTVKCAFCRGLMPLTDAARFGGVCRLCASEIAELGWRTVYDREQNLGQIPANLRAAYKL